MARNSSLSTGEYYENASGGEPAMGDYFASTPGGQMTGLGDYFSTTPGGQMTGLGRSPDGLGSLADLSPFVRDWKRFRRAGKGLRGLGQDEPQTETVQSPYSPAVVGGALLVGALVRGWAGYAVGNAVAPDAASQNKWAWWGVPIGIFFGTLGLGIQAAVALSKR